MPAAPEPCRSQAASVRILLVGTSTPAVVTLLLADGWALQQCPDRSAMLAALTSQRPQLIILDLTGNQHALDLLRQLKRDAASAAIPVLLINAAASRAALMQALQAGAEDSLAAPLDPELLQWRVRQLLRLTGASSPPGPATPVPAAASTLGGQLSATNLPAAVLDALPATVAVFDRHGTLVLVNQAWRDFAELNGLAAAANFGLGSNYLAACDRPATVPDGDGVTVANGIRAVLSGTASQFSLEYPCHTALRQRWFMLTVAPLGNGPDGALTMHLDVTQKHLAEQALRERDLQFRQMADHIRDIFFLVDAASWQVLYVSPAYQDITGHSCASLYADPASWASAIVPADRRRFVAAYARHRKRSSARYDDSFQIQRPDHSLRWVAIKLFSIPGANGSVARIAGVAQDITEAKLAVRELRESQRRFLELLNNSTLLSVMLDLDGRVTFCNAALLRLTGLRHAAVIGSDWFATFMAAEHAPARAHFLSLLSNQPTSLRYEDEIVRADGTRCLICWNSSILHDSEGKVIGTASIGEDITAQKQSALKIQTLNTNLEKMSRQLLHAQEQERISLARELHDELGQRLALLKIDLYHLQPYLTVPAAQAAWQVIDAAVLTLIAQIRVISVSLRPPSLDHLGLESAVRQLLERQFASGQCRYIFEYAGLPAKLAPQVEIAVYRIVQESITNIVRHAAASYVVVELNGGESGRELELIVRDNGHGFASGATSGPARPDGSGAGLRGMQERVALLGGSFSIDSSAACGTRIVVALALEPV